MAEGNLILTPQRSIAATNEEMRKTSRKKKRNDIFREVDK